ncbi:hypothetical protein B0H17DRAFT_1341239 [Mycena rosella]|uniref:Uncharacterized protein n=1 Tax=Mycena rosella TaxID=1033263 RepID=A0AAD7FDR1_MYCRO|nr:hypothetical protein B0H17DRAFT_1341239 [Mycena rosella]
MVPGVPFACEIDGKPDQLHTIGAVHTLPSLRHETDFWDILKDTIIVAKGLRGCRPVGNTDEVFPITDFPLKPNDLSPVNVAGDSKAGSYNLASTLLKGVGPGVVLPATKVDTPEFRGQLLAKALGWQGRMHTDPRDAPTRKTYFLALLSLPPGSDAGAFLLGRHGIYIRELDTWAIHIFFDGVDIHTGIGATTTLSVPEFQKWVESDLETAWKLSEYSCIGVVQYASQAAHSRDAYMSMTPSVRFGNFGPEQHHLAIQRDFETHGQEILGGQEPWANRMGREIVQGFWNQLQHCNLDLGIDINHLLQSITFKNDSGADINLKPLPWHPVKDADSIARQRGHYEFFRQQCERMHIYIEKSHYHAYQKRLREETYDPAEDNNSWTVTWKSRSSFPTKSGNRADVPPSDISGSIVKIVEHVRVASQANTSWLSVPSWTNGTQGCYRILTDEPDASPQLIKENDPRLQRQMVTEFLANQLKKISSVPLILVPLVQGVQSGDGKGKKPLRKPTKPTGISLGNTQHLEALLNPDRLGVEVAEVKEARPAVGRASKMFFQALESPSFVPTILETCLSQHSLLSTFQIVVDADWTSPQQVAIAQFNSLATSTSVMSKLTAYERVTGLLTRILQLTNSCALITIYRWCSSIGPQIVKALFELHRDKGHRAFTANPSLGLLVDHIVQFVCDAKTRAVEKERAMATKMEQASSSQPDISNNPPSSPPPRGHSAGPGDDTLPDITPDDGFQELEDLVSLDGALSTENINRDAVTLIEVLDIPTVKPLWKIGNDNRILARRQEALVKGLKTINKAHLLHEPETRLPIWILDSLAILDVERHLRLVLVQNFPVAKALLIHLMVIRVAAMTMMTATAVDDGLGISLADDLEMMGYLQWILVALALVVACTMTMTNLDPSRNHISI